MKQLIRRLCAMLMCALMLCPGAQAAVEALDWATGGYLDGSDELRFHMTAQIGSLPPYGEGTLEMMNALLPYLSVEGRVSANDSELAFSVAGDRLITLSETRADVGTQLTTSLLPNRTLISNHSVTDALLGLDRQETSFDGLAAIMEAQECYQLLTEAIRPYAEEKTASYSIKGVGSARWVRLARLETEQSAEILPLIAQVLGCGMDAAYREQLSAMTCQKGFVVALYQTKEGGKDLAVYIKGNAIFPDGVQRSISYQWAFANNDKGQRVDTYKLDMTKASGQRDTRQITASYKRSNDASTLLVDGTAKASVRNPETTETVTTTTTHKLSGSKGAITGSCSQAVRTAIGETASTVTMTVKPDLKVTTVDGSAALTGKVHVETLRGSTVHASVDLLFDEDTAEEVIEAAETGTLFVVVDDRQPRSSLTQNLDLGKDEPEEYLVGKPPIGYTAYTAPKENSVTDVDSAAPEEISALMDEMAQRLAGSLLTAIAKLPEDATALIRDNLSQEDYAAFLQLLEE